jgi:hypothetical protein
MKVIPETLYWELHFISQAVIAKTEWLEIMIMCPSRAKCISANCCCNYLALLNTSNINMLPWLKADIISSKFNLFSQRFLYYLAFKHFFRLAYLTKVIPETLYWELHFISTYSLVKHIDIHLRLVYRGENQYALDTTMRKWTQNI